MRDKIANITRLTRLQRWMLALLEEAGEDDVSALLNSTGARVGSPSKVDAIMCALLGLVELDIVRIAKKRDGNALRWVPLSMEESKNVVRALPELFQWSSVDGLWKWPPAASRAEVLLTIPGVSVARKVLSEDGWPQ